MPEHAWRGDDDAGVRRLHRMTAPRELVRARTAADAHALRDELNRFIWGPGGAPVDAQPHDCRHDVTVDRLRLLNGVDVVDELIVRTAVPGIVSHMYLIRPRTPNGRAVLYHHGHTHHTEIANIQAFVGAGYGVLICWMPLLGPNPRTILVKSQRFGYLEIGHHDDLALLEPSMTGSPVQLFLAPVITGLNYLERSTHYEIQAMVGLSGGGWTTTLVAALDPRLVRTYPVAGTLPIWLRVGTRDWRSGDYEENLVALYAIADYLDLYVLGSWGHDRRQVQIMNRYDSRCFAGTRPELYVDAVQETLAELGPGEFRVHLDATHGDHTISTSALALILDDLTDWETDCDI